MKKEITLESVFQAGFKQGWTRNKNAQEPTGPVYFSERGYAWHNYVEELEADNVAK